MLAALLVPALLWIQPFSRADERAPGTFTRWKDGSVHGPWKSVFDGHGRNGARDGVLSLRPQAPARPSATHAGLIVSVAAFTELDFELEARTVKALREPEGNPWEVAWIVWAYTDPEHFYYLALKPNGWELGKRDPAYPGGQRFLATGDEPYPLGSWYAVRISQRGATLRVAVGGDDLTEFTDHERPYPSGAVGVYSEDAVAEFRAITVNGTRH